MIGNSSICQYVQHQIKHFINSFINLPNPMSPQIPTKLIQCFILLMISNSAVNPFIYFLFNREFRSSAISMFKVWSQTLGPWVPSPVQGEVTGLTGFKSYAGSAGCAVGYVTCTSWYSSPLEICLACSAGAVHDPKLGPLITVFHF